MTWVLLWLACSSSVPPVPAPPAAGELVASYEVGPDEEALGERIRRVKRAPGEPDGWSALAVAMLDRQRMTGADVYLGYAEDAANAALARDPRQLPAHHVRLRVLHGRHRFADVAAQARVALAEFPDDPTLTMLLGDAELELGRYEAAHEAYQAALDARPDLRSYNRGAYLRWVFGDLDGAIELMAQAIAAGGPGLPEPTAFCYVDLAQLQLRAGRPALALQAVDAALALVPGYRYALSTQAEAYRMRGDRDAAVAGLRALARPSVPDLLRLAELDESWAVDDRVNEDPGAVAFFLARHQRDPARALTLAQSAQAERPTIEHLNAYALALLRSGDVLGAAAASDRAVAWGTADARLHLVRGLIAAAGGDETGARASLERAQALNAAEDPVLMAELTQVIGS